MTARTGLRGGLIVAGLCAIAACSMSPRPAPRAELVSDSLQTVLTEPDSVFVARMEVASHLASGPELRMASRAPVDAGWSRRFVAITLQPNELLEPSACRIETLSRNNARQLIVGVAAYRGSQVALARVLFHEQCVEFAMNGAWVGAVKLSPPLAEMLGLVGEALPADSVVQRFVDAQRPGRRNGAGRPS